ncbi:unnamed protein product [Closterium sp. NIES-53]
MSHFPFLSTRVPPSRAIPTVPRDPPSRSICAILQQDVLARGDGHDGRGGSRLHPIVLFRSSSFSSPPISRCPPPSASIPHSPPPPASPHTRKPVAPVAMARKKSGFAQLLSKGGGEQRGGVSTKNCHPRSHPLSPLLDPPVPPLFPPTVPSATKNVSPSPPPSLSPPTSPSAPSNPSAPLASAPLASHPLPSAITSPSPTLLCSAHYPPHPLSLPLVLLPVSALSVPPSMSGPPEESWRPP